MPSIKRNYIYYLLNQIVTFLIPLLVTPYISRVLGPDKIGINSYTTANVTYFTLFMNLGISGYAQRELSITRNNKEEESKIFWELQCIHLIMAIIVFGTYIAMVAIIASSKYRIYYIVNVLTLLSSLFDISWLYQAEENFIVLTIRNILVRLSIVVCTFIFVHEQNDLWKYVLINSLGLLVANIVMWLGVKNNLPLVPIKALRPIRHLKDVMIFFIPTIAASVYSILDKSVISWVTHSDAQNGYYEQASAILSLCNAAVQAFANVSSPRMSYLFANNDSHDEFDNRLNQAIQYMLFISIPLAFGIYAVTPNFIPVYLGKKFLPSIPLLYTFLPLIVVLGFSTYLDGMYLIPSGKRLQSAIAICIGAGLNLILNFVLVNFLQALGAAIATLVTESLISLIMIMLSRKVIRHAEIMKTLLKYILFSVAMAAIVRSIVARLPIGMTSLVIEIICGILIYLVILVITKDKMLFSIKDAIQHNRHK